MRNRNFAEQSEGKRIGRTGRIGPAMYRNVALKTQAENSAGLLLWAMYSVWGRDSCFTPELSVRVYSVSGGLW